MGIFYKKVENNIFEQVRVGFLDLDFCLWIYRE